MDNLKPFKYYAFISYKSEDAEWAIWLQHELEHYHLPSSFNGRDDIRQELRPVFRDLDELSAGNLPTQIQQALNDSKNLIVICSPQAAKSEWVNEEVKTFISLGRIDNVFPFIVDGNSKNDFFPKALRNLADKDEKLGGDVRISGRDAAFVKVVAGMLGLPFDSLWQRYEKEKIEQEEKERKNKERLQRIESLYIAEHSDNVVRQYGIIPAIKIILEAVPKKDNERPYVVEADSKLFELYRTYEYLDSILLHTIYSKDQIISNPANNDVVVRCNNQTIALIDLETFQKKWDCSIEQDGRIFSVHTCENGSLIFVQTWSDLIYVLDSSKGNYVCAPLEGYFVDSTINGDKILYKKNDAYHVFDVKSIITRQIEVNDTIEFASFINDIDDIILINHIGEIYTIKDKAKHAMFKYKKYKDVNIRYKILKTNKTVYILAAYGNNYIISIWDVIKKRNVGKNYTHDIFIGITACDDRIILQRDDSIVIKDFKRNKNISKLPVGNFVFFSKKLNLLLVRRKESLIDFIDCYNGIIKKTIFLPFYKNISEVEYAPFALNSMGDYLLCYKNRFTYIVRNGLTHSAREYYTFSEPNIQCMAFSPDGNKFAYGKWNGDIVVVVKHPNNTSTEKILSSHEFAVSSIVITNNNIISGGLDNKICIWDMSCLDENPECINVNGAVTSLNITEDSSSIIAITNNNAIEIIDINNKTTLYIPYKFGIANISKDGQYLLYGHEDGTVRIWDVLSGSEKASISFNNSFMLNSIKFTKMGNRVWAINNGNIVIWDISLNQKIIDSPIESNCFAISADGRLIVCEKNERFLLYDVDSHQCLLSKPHGNMNKIISIRFTVDKRRIIVEHDNGIISLYDSQSLTVITPEFINNTKCREHYSMIDDVLFCANGKRVAIRYNNGDVIISNYSSSDAIIKDCVDIFANVDISHIDKKALGLDWISN